MSNEFAAPNNVWWYRSKITTGNSIVRNNVAIFCLAGLTKYCITKMITNVEHTQMRKIIMVTSMKTLSIFWNKVTHERVNLSV